jgi:flavin reductase (DIM6/NTAB) family NADH-FMN oxidoreductase RutF
MQIDFDNISPAMSQQWLQHAVAPRPICFASTINAAGEVNLSPFSFFNLFSMVPPVLIFSPSRRMRDNTTKHTLENILEVPEVVINMVDYDMVQQTSLSSCEFPKGVNEFIKAGFRSEPATLVRPPMVAESKIKMECRVLEVKALGDKGGAGNLVICEVLRMHVTDSILNADGNMIDQRKMPHVARLGGNWYSKVDEHSLFEVEKPNTQLGIGIDHLPESIRNSVVLSGNNLGQLANVPEVPMVDATFDDARLRNIFQYFAIDPGELERELHQYARELLAEGKVRDAWQVLLSVQ